MRVSEITALGVPVSPAKVARELGVSRQRVWQVCIEHGIEIVHRRGRVPRPRPTKPCDACGKPVGLRFKRHRGCQLTQVVCSGCGVTFRKRRSLAAKVKRHHYCNRLCFRLNLRSVRVAEGLAKIA